MADIIILGYLINFILIIAIIFFQRRDPVVSVAWFFCLATLPVIGSILFLIFGFGLKNRTRKRYLQKQELNNNILSSSLRGEADIKVSELKNSQHSNLYNYLKNAAKSPLTFDNDVTIFTNGEEKFEMLIKDIKNAKSSINLLYFIIHNDDIGNRIIDELCKKANSGVEVRLLYDGFGSLLTPKRYFNNLRKCRKGHVAEFFPVRLFSFSKLNHRNHRKIAVIDGKIAYLGGMNIGDEYLNRKKLNWRDTHMRIVGSAVAEIQKYFALDWEFSTNERLTNRLLKFFPYNASEKDGVSMQIVASGPDSPAEEIKCGMMKMISNAKKHIYIQTPYFVPDKSFLESVKTAAESGVDVRLMIPGTPDKPYVYYTTLSYMGELLDSGVRVFLYPGFIHSKSITVDNEVSTIGTTNIDTRSFVLHFELNAFIYDEELSCQCKKIFEDDMKISKELTKENYAKRGVLNIIKEGFFRLFSPIM